MRRFGCASTYCLFYSLLLSSGCSSWPRLLRPTRSHHHGAARPSSSSHPAPAVPITLSHNNPAKITPFPHRTPHQPIRDKRQSEGSSLVFPAALEGAAPPSQYPWAILWDPTVSDEEGSQGSSTPRPYYHQEWGLLEPGEPARGLDLKGVPATPRPHGFPSQEEGTDPQLYVTIVISVLIVLVAAGIIVKFCCERRQKRRRNRNERCALPEEGSLQPLTDLSPDTDITGLHPLKLADFNKSGLDERSAPCRTTKIPVVTM